MGELYPDKIDMYLMRQSPGWQDEKDLAEVAVAEAPCLDNVLPSLAPQSDSAAGDDCGYAS
ncbi:MAG: hypothetical protein WC370_09920 [Dehalococcoidales bacterium]|jgi:hypothetical protein